MKAISSPFLILAILFFFILTSCSKDENKNIGDGVSNKNLTGYILHQYTSEVKKLDVVTGKESNFFSYSAYSAIGWDVSRDGTIRIMAEREPGVYDRTRLKMIKVSDQTIIKEFDYDPKYGTNTSNMGELSFDNSLLLIEPDFENGIVILNDSGEELFRLDGINDQAFTANDKVTWLPNNGLLIRFGNRYIFRADPPYESLNLIKEMNYENWGNMRVSNNGEKVSMYINKHIFIMDIDGSNLTQVTESDGDEAFGEFSPDDKYLLIGADYFHAPASNNSHWYLKIIPADGKKYNLDTDSEVIPVIPSGSNSPVKANRLTRWRP